MPTGGIVVDKDTFREGERGGAVDRAASGRWVLFGVEGEALGDYQVVKLEGSSKLVERRWPSGTCRTSSHRGLLQRRPVQHRISFSAPAAALPERHRDDRSRRVPAARGECRSR
jgi:hypothetical protein